MHCGSSPRPKDRNKRKLKVVCCNMGKSFDVCSFNSANMKLIIDRSWIDLVIYLTNVTDFCYKTIGSPSLFLFVFHLALKQSLRKKAPKKKEKLIRKIAKFSSVYYKKVFVLFSLISCISISFSFYE